jgi:uncharacterized membrane protein YuzA (DUF378 family)
MPMQKGIHVGLSELINHLCQKLVVVGDISSHVVGLMMIDFVQ